ncbi:(2Fe-2S)-binding protein [Hyphomicrobium sp.]|uniref:(2Fe-2S)-binding protein n=1 Tax=Hyphomicrobium sp. TaxID=82 RepID=UPI002FE34342
MHDLSVNGSKLSVSAPDDMPLLWVLRDIVGLMGTKFGCGIAQCGACLVHVDGEPRRSCVTPIRDVAGSNVTTIEAVGVTSEGKAVQKAWIEFDVPQCGYCQSGQVMSAAALLSFNSAPTDVDIDAGMAGNICRCGTYPRIRDAIKAAARDLGGEQQ